MATALFSDVKLLETASDIDDAISKIKESMISNIDKTIRFMDANYNTFLYLGLDRKVLESGFSFEYNEFPEYLEASKKKEIVEYIKDLDFFISVIIRPKNTYTGDDYSIISFETPRWMLGMTAEYDGFTKEDDLGAKCCIMNVIPNDVSEGFYKDEFAEMKKIYGDKVYNLSYPTLGYIDLLMAFTPNTFAVKKEALNDFISNNKQRYLLSSERLQFAIYHRIVKRDIDFRNLDYCSFIIEDPSKPKGLPTDIYGAQVDMNSKNLLPQQAIDSLKYLGSDYAGTATVCFPCDVVRDPKDCQRMTVMIPTKEIKYSVDKNNKAKFLVGMANPNSFEEVLDVGYTPLAGFWTKTDLPDRMLLSDDLKKFIVSSSEKQAKWNATRNVIGTFRIDPKANGKLFISQAFDADVKQIDLNKSFMSDPDGYHTLVKDILGSLDIKDYYSLTTSEGVGMVFISKKIVGSLKLVRAVKNSDISEYLGKEDPMIGLSTPHGKIIWYSDEIADNKDLSNKNLKTLEEMFTATIGKDNYDAAIALIALGEKDPFKKLKLKK